MPLNISNIRKAGIKHKRNRIFENQEFGTVRTILIDGKIYFAGIDVARALGYSNTRDAISRHCRGVIKHDGVVQTTNQYGKITNQKVEMSYITEGDIYRLIMRRQHPSAERFESWVCDEVLPEIRKTGNYISEKKPDSYTIEDPAECARRWAEEYEEKDALEEKIKEMEPKAYIYDKILDSKLLTNFRDAAKEIEIS